MSAAKMPHAQIVRDGQILANDTLTLAEDAALPASGRILVSLARWRKENEALLGSACTIGVLIPNTEDVAGLWPELQHRPLIAVHFPAWSDGRAYSQARVLRERYGYLGEVRATGDVARDQLQFMQRCGINAFEIRADQDPALCLKSLHDFDVAYQQAADSLPNVWAARRAKG